MKATLCSVSIDKVLFMGGEPTVAKELPVMLDFAEHARREDVLGAHQRQPSAAAQS